MNIKETIAEKRSELNQHQAESLRCQQHGDWASAIEESEAALKALRYIALLDAAEAVGTRGVTRGVSEFPPRLPQAEVFMGAATF